MAMAASTTTALRAYSMASIALKKVVKPPSMIANALDWKKASGGSATVMTIDVHADRIGLALATFGGERSVVDVDEYDYECNNEYEYDDNHHNRPSYFNCRVLDSIPLVTTVDDNDDNNNNTHSGNYSNSINPTTTTTTSRRGRNPKRRKRVVSPEDKRRLSGLVREYNISGFVVSWPVQQDTGLMGASCGRTLWTLEQLLLDEEDDEHDGQDDSQDNNNNNNRRISPIFTPNRPLCLWDGIHREQPKTDAFGRCSIYSRTSNKTEHSASKEQYHQDESVIAAQVWKDFCESHWPVNSSNNNTNNIINNNNNNNIKSNSAAATLVQSRYNGNNEEMMTSSYSNRVSTSKRRTLVAA